LCIECLAPAFALCIECLAPAFALCIECLAPAFCALHELLCPCPLLCSVFIVLHVALMIALHYDLLLFCVTILL
jgi:hypothetical protein